MLNRIRRLRARLAQAVEQRQRTAAVAATLQHYGELARAVEFDQLYLFLSFDCDTDLDIDVVERLHAYLASLGIRATYAVPGTQLEKGASTYLRVARAGGEFINHGGRPHAEWHDDQWVGTTFYEQMSATEVVADIERGHAIVSDIIGQAPVGFRAPHFGCYQSNEQLARLHQTAAKLGYRYCSTTIPRFGLERGPAFASSGLLEFPCSGSAPHPETLLDSWTYLTDRRHYTLGEEYYSLVAATLAHYRKHAIPGVLTWYADPCHAFGQAPFHRAMELLARSGILSVTGTELANLVHKQAPQLVAQSN